MTTPKIALVDLKTSQTEIREMTDNEIAEVKEMDKESKEAQIAQDEARKALLAKLGITEEEAKLLLS